MRLIVNVNCLFNLDRHVQKTVTKALLTNLFFIFVYSKIQPFLLTSMSGLTKSQIHFHLVSKLIQKEQNVPNFILYQ